MNARVSPSELHDAPPTRRQRKARRAVRMSGFATTATGSPVRLHLKDLSYDGCRIAAPGEFKAGERIKLAVAGLGAIDAEVRWANDGEAGLVFAPSEEPPRQHWPRRSERLPISADVALRRPGHFTYRVRVVDASPDGCKVEFVERPQVGERLSIKFDGLEILEARVRWVEGFAAGLNFSRPIHPAVFDLLIERLRQGD